ncbi:putative multidrug export ATP-binding/permease protein [Dinoroseobacter shibae DFL 12 = DSM 16493]|jgi:ATP-binding cassette subfamily B protein|uniref:Putative multidrug export ATP-binding/permease protein n=1 Tax=Dinoroseobacter shibae (strain DSM 16493 / NCIMB 14021 / DFL 12) TaxID=398580 RepID=A8LP48_DINSH|nr:ABC transporter ATP-binding protein [Dinoroseobacter shibae]ABV93730.1 putative multidrug export ATP-binding/permease protein [Dinoroseobacter shibae DFL 12 = DSM 16493]URF45184.1 ABC transporter ATP-binding protein/permease [Dinoroseobacter shibae]URF49489.1 ABC transporter ATP-binding protein/permease [Dinoroseobacter shibae]
MARSGSRPSSLAETAPGLRRVLRRLAPFMRDERPLIAGGALAMLAAVFAKLAEPWPLKFVIDMFVPGRGGTEPGMPFGLTDPIMLLVLCALSIVLVMGLRATFEFTARVTFALAGARVLAKVRATLFEHLQRLPVAFHQKSRPGDLTLRLISDVGMLKETTVTAALPLAVNALVLVGMIAVMLWIDWQLALIALSPLPVLWLMTMRIGRRIQSVSRKTRKTEGAMAASASEAMSNVAIVQALGLEKAMSKDFLGDNAAELKQGVQSKRLTAGLERRVDILVGVGIGLVLLFGGLSILDGRTTPGDLIVFLTYLKNTFKPVRDYAKYAARLAKATAAGERVIALLDEDTKLTSLATPVKLPETQGGIAFENVSLNLGGSEILKDISISIRAGERVAITGPSGSGKSTLLSLAMRLQDPDAGAVRLDGRDLRALAVEDVRDSFAFVPQDPVLFHASIARNLGIAARHEPTPDEIIAAAQLAGAHDFILSQPQGYDTVLAERGSTLSGGQRQRLSFTRAALRNAPIFLLDEPTTGLDATTQANLADAIWQLTENRTLLMVTHDLHLAARADRVICLEGGRIVANGRHEDVLAQGGLYAKLWAEQMQTGVAHAAE